MKTVIKRLARLEERSWPAERKPRWYFRMIVCRYGGRMSLDNATCRRTLCADGTVMEFVELYGVNEGPERITAEELDRWVASFPIQVSGMESAR